MSLGPASGLPGGSTWDAHVDKIRMAATLTQHPQDENQARETPESPEGPQLGFGDRGATQASHLILMTLSIR